MNLQESYAAVQDALQALQEAAERSNFAATWTETQIASAMLAEAFASDSEHAG